jgi:hypothetical protein
MYHLRFSKAAIICLGVAMCAFDILFDLKAAFLLELKKEKHNNIHNDLQP